jgi:hypothetical protein
MMQKPGSPFRKKKLLCLGCSVQCLKHKLRSSATASAEQELLVLCEPSYVYLIKDSTWEDKDGYFAENNFESGFKKEKGNLRLKACPVAKELPDGFANWEWGVGNLHVKACTHWNCELGIWRWISDIPSSLYWNVASRFHGDVMSMIIWKKKKPSFRNWGQSSDLSMVSQAVSNLICWPSHSHIRISNNFVQWVLFYTNGR